MTLEKACKMLLIDNPFFGLYLLGMSKQYSTISKTACVRRNGINIELHVNQEFWNELSDKQQEGLLIHELYHVCLKHMFFYELFPKQNLRNIAEDFEVNSYINRDMLPEGALFPENYGLPPRLGRNEYYKILDIIDNKQSKANGQSDDSGKEGNEGKSNDTGKTSSSSEKSKASNGSDKENSASDIVDGLSEEDKENLKDLINSSSIDHSAWGDFNNASEAEKELIKNQIDHIMKQAAEQLQKLRGVAPGGLETIIANLFKQKPAIFNWKTYFRRLLGTAIDVEVKKTRKKESVRFPEASGLKHKRKSNIFLIIDTSGSVSNKELCDFFSEINNIYKAGTKVTICECDTQIQKIYSYNGKLPEKINGRGGTIIRPAIEYFNEHRRDYQTVIFFTDGYVESDLEKIMGPAIWVITAEGNTAKKFPGKTIYIPKENKE